MKVPFMIWPIILFWSLFWLVVVLITWEIEMGSKKYKKILRNLFSLIFIVSLFIILFVWRKFDPETGTRQWIVVSNWLSHFRKWLDVSGWTKLVFRVSYEKYEEIYKDPQELNEIKKLIETIVLKNIDKRISRLWVSDYKAYMQTLNEQQYIVVEIWWVTDLDQAKEIIWKTVELEFRLPNTQEPSQSIIQERKEKAKFILQEVKENPEMMSSLADWRWAENVFYNYFSGVTIWDLPDIYQENIKLIDSANIWEISDLLEWIYANITTQDQNWVFSDIELKWYSFFRLVDKKIQTKTFIVADDIIQTANMIWLKNEKLFSKEENEIWLNKYEYIANDLIFNQWELWAWQNAYNAKIFSITTPSSIWLSQEEQDNIDKEIDQKVNYISDNINKKWFNIQSWVKLVNDWRISESDLKVIISNFDTSNTEKIQTYKRFDTNYVVQINDQKSPTEKIYSIIKVYWVDKDIFEEKLKNSVVYDIEDVFVQDRETRKLAIWSKSNRVLNWAYFKFANVSSSQIWQPVVLINFDDAWKDIFCEITEENIWNQMAIFIWWNLLTSPTIQSRICGWWAQIDWQFTPQSARELVNSLNDWALPAPLILMQEEKVDPTLWENAFKWALVATAFWIIAIYVFMLLLYNSKKSFVALGTIIMFIVVLLAILKSIDYALSLSGIAAVILSLWMAVDANVLIFERFREELKEWKSTWWAIDLAVSKSRSAIRDWQLSTWLIALVLFSMWISIFKWFGSMMLITIILTLLVNVTFTKELLKIFYHKKQ